MALTSRLSDQLGGDDADIVLIDKTEDFVFGFSKLDVMFGRTTPDAVRHPYGDVVRPFDDASELYLAEKSDFGTDRVRRWFRRDWTSY